MLLLFNKLVHFASDQMWMQGGTEHMACSWIDAWIFSDVEMKSLLVEVLTLALFRTMSY